MIKWVRPDVGELYEGPFRIGTVTVIDSLLLLCLDIFTELSREPSDVDQVLELSSGHKLLYLKIPSELLTELGVGKCSGEIVIYSNGRGTVQGISVRLLLPKSVVDVVSSEFLRKVLEFRNVVVSWLRSRYGE
ncbi:MAG: hypothetical protein DRJ40_07620 [Thermoprotei archaeon]|nr:MAG: hypothetical protein DRJ40_07620 [Thermoprotei archaeon]